MLEPSNLLRKPQHRLSVNFILDQLLHHIVDFFEVEDLIMSRDLARLGQLEEGLQLILRTDGAADDLVAYIAVRTASLPNES